MEIVILVSAIILIAVLIAWPLLWLRRRQIDSFVNRWVKEQGFELIKYEERTFLISPFPYKRSYLLTPQIVLVELKAHQGDQKKCLLMLDMVCYEPECKWVE